MREDAVGGAAGVDVDSAEAAEEDGHLGRGEGEELRAVHQHLLRGDARLRFLVVAEAIRERLENRERGGIGLFGSGIGAAGAEGNAEGVACVFCGLLHAGTTGEDDEVGERDFFAAGLGAVERAADAFEGFQHLAELGGFVHLPILLRGEADAGAVRAAALVGAAEGGCRGPGGADEFGNRESRREDFCFEGRDVGGVHERVVPSRDGVLPNQLLLRHLGSEVAGAGSHVAVGEFEPGAGEGIGELGGVREEPA